MEKEYVKIGNIVRIISLYWEDEKKNIKIGDMFTITVVTEYEDPSIYGHKSGIAMSLNQLEFVEQETPFAQILRERFGLVDGDKFRFKNENAVWENAVWEMLDSSFYEDGIFIEDNKMFDGVVIDILSGEQEIEKIIEPILIEVIINGEKFKITEELAKEVIVFMTSREGE